MNKEQVILIVDDNPDNLALVGNILKKSNHRLLFAQSGVHALKAIYDKQPDLILLDVMMPDLDGFAVCKQLKQDTNFADIPIIFLTAKAEKDNVIAGLELGAVDYITKPFNSKELITRVDTHLELKMAKEDLKQRVAELSMAKIELAHKVEELKQANLTKDKFFSIISHDLMNPFSGLIGFASLLVDKNQSLNEKQRDECIDHIFQLSKQGLNLLTNLLDWSRSQTGRMEVTPMHLNLKSIVDGNIKLLHNQVTAKQIQFFSTIDSKQTVFADERMLTTIIRNLLSNAIKFTPDRGEITVSAQEKDNYLEILIADTGIGMTAEILDKIFRIDVSHTTKGTHGERGTGLGLILCKEFIEKNRGTITATSEQGKGSQFYVCFPRSNPRLD